MKHLRYNYMTANLSCNEHRHAQVIMKELRIKYQFGTPQTAHDEYWFWNCENLPEELSKFISELGFGPEICIGYGLNSDDVKSILDYKG